MKMQVATLTLSLALGAASLGVAAGVDSLRGSDLTAASAKPEKRKVEVVQGGFDRSFR